MSEEEEHAQAEALDIIHKASMHVDGEVEGVLCASSVAIGAWLLNPFIDTFASSKAYEAFLDLFLPEWVWGIAMICGGFAGMLALYKDNHRWRERLTFGSAAIWCLFAWVFIVGNSAGVGAPAFMVYAGAAIWVRWRMFVVWGGERNG